MKDRFVRSVASLAEGRSPGGAEFYGEVSAATEAATPKNRPPGVLRRCSNGIRCVVKVLSSIWSFELLIFDVSFCHRGVVQSRARTL